MLKLKDYKLFNFIKVKIKIINFLYKNKNSHSLNIFFIENFFIIKYYKIN